MNGSFNRVLHKDLSNRDNELKYLDESILTRYLGGKGLTTHLLMENNLAGVDPLFCRESSFSGSGLGYRQFALRLLLSRNILQILLAFMENLTQEAT
jgi:aldehyde:ferredoxin oxidoreductase